MGIPKPLAARTRSCLARDSYVGMQCCAGTRLKPRAHVGDVRVSGCVRWFDGLQRIPVGKCAHEGLLVVF
jgi:hypothetical protein